MPRLGEYPVVVLDEDPVAPRLTERVAVFVLIEYGPGAGREPQVLAITAGLALAVLLGPARSKVRS